MAVKTQQIIGHEPILNFISEAAQKGRLAHAYLFAGPEHVGKQTTARELARTLLGAQELSTQPNFVFLERERDAKTGKLHGSIVLDQVHALTGRLSLGAFGGNGFKICVIDGAETLTTEAANALLKTLEEPRPKTVLILLASAETAVLPTIRSRCQVMLFGRVPATVIAETLISRGLTKDKAVLYAGLSGGLPGKAVAYAQDPMVLNEMFALRENLLRFPGISVAERWAVIDKLVPAKMPFQEAGDKAVQIINLASELLHDAMIATGGGAISVPIHADAAAQTAAWAKESGAAKLADLAERITESRELIDGNVNPRTVLERLALSF